MRKRLRFEKRGLNDYSVYNKKDELLGEIWLNSQWKKYVFEMHAGCYFDESCLNEVIIFLKSLDQVQIK